MTMSETDNSNTKQNTPKLLFVVRIRGAPGMKRKTHDTLRMLRMHRVNHGVLIFPNKSYAGMLQKVKDYIAYGEINKKMLLKLIRKRAFVEGNEPLTESHIKLKTKYKTLNALTEGLLKGEIQYKDIDKIKPVFRMHPPRGGYRGTIKLSYAAGGSLGYVGDYINTLLFKML
jgi:large subunit ribosomal protein L30